MGRLRTNDSRQAKHDAAVLRDLTRCRDAEGRLDLSVLPPGRRKRVQRHMRDTLRAMREKALAAQKTPPPGKNDTESHGGQS